MERKFNQEHLLKLIKQQELIIEQVSNIDMEKLMDIYQLMERICITLLPTEDTKKKIRTKEFQEEYGVPVNPIFLTSLTQQSRKSIHELIVAIANKEETKTNPELVNALSTLIQASKDL